MVELIHLSHKNLIAPITGIIEEGISESGTKGVKMFFPTDKPKELIKSVMEL